MEVDERPLFPDELEKLEELKVRIRHLMESSPVDDPQVFFHFGLLYDALLLSGTLNRNQIATVRTFMEMLVQGISVSKETYFNMRDGLVRWGLNVAPPEPIVRVGTAAILTDSEGRILMGERRGSHGAGTWSLPGGHLDFGEEPEDAIRREVKEETGLDVGQVLTHDLFPVANTHFREEGKQYITLFYVAEYIGGEPQVLEPEKCGGWHWFPHDDLPRPLFGALEGGGFWESLK